MDKSFYLLGGAAWLNLINTRYRHNMIVHDLLDDPDRLIDWLDANQLLPIDESNSLNNGGARVSYCELLKEYRERCKTMLEYIHGEVPQFDKAAVLLQESVAQLKLEPRISLEDKKLSINYEGSTPADNISYGIIHSIIETLRAYSTNRIRKCEHEECILYFVDISKGGKRRWCSMEVCGNRNKAAEFYSKKKRRGQMEGFH